MADLILPLHNEPYIIGDVDVLLSALEGILIMEMVVYIDVDLEISVNLNTGAHLIKAIECEVSGGSPMDAWLSVYLTREIRSLNLGSVTCLAIAKETENH